MKNWGYLEPSYNTISCCEADLSQTQFKHVSVTAVTDKIFCSAAVLVGKVLQLLCGSLVLEHIHWKGRKDSQNLNVNKSSS